MPVICSSNPTKSVSLLFFLNRFETCYSSTFFVCYAERISSNLHIYNTISLCDPLYSLPGTLYFGQVSQTLKITKFDSLCLFLNNNPDGELACGTLTAKWQHK